MQRYADTHARVLIHNVKQSFHDKVKKFEVLRFRN